MPLTAVSSAAMRLEYELEFQTVRKILNDLNQGVSRTSDKEQKDYYGYLILKLKNFLAGR